MRLRHFCKSSNGSGKWIKVCLKIYNEITKTVLDIFGGRITFYYFLNSIKSLCAIVYQTIPGPLGGAGGGIRTLVLRTISQVFHPVPLTLAK